MSVGGINRLSKTFSEQRKCNRHCAGKQIKNPGKVINIVNNKKNQNELNTK